MARRSARDPSQPFDDEDLNDLWNAGKAGRTALGTMAHFIHVDNAAANAQSKATYAKRVSPKTRLKGRIELGVGGVLTADAALAVYASRFPILLEHLSHITQYAPQVQVVHALEGVVQGIAGLMLMNAGRRNLKRFRHTRRAQQLGQERDRVLARVMGAAESAEAAYGGEIDPFKFLPLVKAELRTVDKALRNGPSRTPTPTPTPTVPPRGPASGGPSPGFSTPSWASRDDFGL